MCTGQAPKWAIKIWIQAYPQHARHAAQAALQITKKLDPHTIITSDHGEALGPALLHGIPPTPQLAEVNPFIPILSNFITEFFFNFF